jgi:hypothetical protein
MSDPYQNERLDEILHDQSGGVTPSMWVGLTLAAILAVAIILLINPRDPGSSVHQMFALKGSSAETTGVSTEPNVAVERRWPAGSEN